MQDWRSVVAALVLLLLGFGYSEVCNENEYQCVEDDSCISIYRVCDLKADCPNGSDESFTVCKSLDPEDKKTHCANGAKISPGMFCNNIVECLDGSDELPQLCGRESAWWGNCTKETELECLPGECVPIARTCNNVIDCSNGRDESLEICMDNCEGCFRCANGVAIEGKHFCDNITHCLDGTDELFNVCIEKDDGTGFEPRTCSEPMDLKFTNNTKFMMRHSIRFVYANQPVEVRCRNSNQTWWNVCMNSGSWHHEFPSCFPRRRNDNPDTNGTNGCPINYYNNETMSIFDQEEDHEVFPPIIDVRVNFTCLSGYDFLPYDLSGDSFTCQDNKKWIHKDFHPRCAKLCRKEQINGLYSLKPSCINGENGTHVDCTDEKSLIPGTIVKFECHSGFEHKTRDEISVVCSEYGTWMGLKELCEKQDKICQYDCASRLNYPLSKGGEHTNSLYATWVVPIYVRNTTHFNFWCTGNLIRLDIVLTAAHCVYGVVPDDVLVGPTGNRSESVTPIGNFQARNISIYGAYSPATLTNDVGIIFLKERMNLRQDQRIVCLPYDDGFILELNGKNSEVTSWNSDGILSSVYGRISEPRRDADFKLSLISNSSLCQGDSGSGVIINCPGDKKCLVGVVSRTGGPGEATSKCNDDVTAASIRSPFLENYIRQSISTNMNCPE